MEATGFKYNWKKMETSGKDRAVAYALQGSVSGMN